MPSRATVVASGWNGNPGSVMASALAVVSGDNFTDAQLASIVANYVVEQDGGGPPPAGLDAESDARRAADIALDHRIDVAEQLMAAADKRASDIAGIVSPSGALTMTLASCWGVDTTGNPYFDPDGATSGQEAWPSLDVQGVLQLTQPAGGIS